MRANPPKYPFYAEEDVAVCGSPWLSDGAALEGDRRRVRRHVEVDRIHLEEQAGTRREHGVIRLHGRPSCVGAERASAAESIAARMFVVMFEDAASGVVMFEETASVVFLPP